MQLFNNKPSSIRGKAFISILLLLASVKLSALTAGDELEVAVVQFEMSAEIVQSEEAYTAAIQNAMDAAMKDGSADLVIFPEYIGVFTSLIPWYDYLVTDRPFEEVWYTIRQSNPEIKNIKELFMREAAHTDRYLNRLWGDLAKKHNVYILSGSRFNSQGGNLYNQAVVYSPEGNAVYRQNKFFLTDFEVDIVGLSSGNIGKTEGFEVKNHHINLTICRDTFLKEWETIHNDGELWIDIKANGVEYTEDQVALFTRALPARLANTEVPYGITACLTGDFLNLFWEGESSIIYNDRGKISYLEVSDEDDSFEIMRETFPDN